MGGFKLVFHPLEGFVQSFCSPHQLWVVVLGKAWLRGWCPSHKVVPAAFLAPGRNLWTSICSPRRFSGCWGPRCGDEGKETAQESRDLLLPGWQSSSLSHLGVHPNLAAVLAAHTQS